MRKKSHYDRLLVPKMRIPNVVIEFTNENNLQEIEKFESLGSNCDGGVKFRKIDSPTLEQHWTNTSSNCGATLPQETPKTRYIRLTTAYRTLFSTRQATRLTGSPSVLSCLIIELGSTPAPRCLTSKIRNPFLRRNSLIRLKSPDSL